jgi:hypothetical protein
VLLKHRRSAALFYLRRKGAEATEVVRLSGSASGGLASSLGRRTRGTLVLRPGIWLSVSPSHARSRLEWGVVDCPQSKLANTSRISTSKLA